MSHDTHHHQKESFITKYIFSQDHKMIARQYLLTAIFMGALGIALSALFLFMGWMAMDHLETKDVVSEHRTAISILVGKVNDAHPGIAIDDLDNKYNPLRGGKTIKN